jgi:hypothetical protein
MSRSFCLLGLLTFAALLAAGPAGTAGPVSWSYSLSTSAGSFAADGGGVDTINLSPSPDGSLTGPANLNLLGFSTLTPDQLDERFNNRSYALRLNLTDNNLHKSGSLVFNGTLDGSLAPAVDGVTVGFDRLSGALDLGNHRFDVTLGLPPAPGLGIVTAQVNVTEIHSSGPPPGPTPNPNPSPAPSPSPSPSPGPGPNPGPNASPEPSTLLLAGLGLTAVGGRVWWRRRRRASPPARA